MRFAVFLVLVGSLCSACSMHKAGSEPALGPGVQMFTAANRSAAPHLRGVTITGKQVDLYRVLGHGLVALNVWASWCGPCRQEMPLLARASARGLRLVGIDERDSTRSALKFAAAHGATYPSLADPDGRLLGQLPMLPQTGIPSTLFLDRRGRVAARVVGPVDRTVLRRILRRLGGTQ
jgi:thiol-disulfide isomerase/thioredoxin